MTTEDSMTIDERRKYLRTMKKRYVRADRGERSRLLDEMEAVTGMHRKGLIRLMHSSLERKPRRKQRGRTYGVAVDDALGIIAESLDYICADRLTPNLVWMANHLDTHGELEASPSLLEQLERISVSTVKRRSKRQRRDRPRLPRKGPRRVNRVKQDIPMKRIPWDVGEPGHFEVDLVHHCGDKASGEYAATLQMIDIATGWSERVAVLGRSYLVMKDAFRRIVTRLPFQVREIHPDNGSEFLNHHMIRFWGELVQGATLSRSRPYQKNDNRHVEQKNATLVRAYLGHERLDSVAQVLAMNQLYDKMWTYYNLFQPVMHLVHKTISFPQGKPTRVKRIHDQARTPFDRLCDTDAISQQCRERLQALRARTNPRRLRQEIYDLIDHIFSLAGAVPGITENVFLTLAFSLSKKGVVEED